MKKGRCFIFFLILSFAMGAHALAAIDALLYSAENADVQDTFDIDVYMAGPDEVVLSRLIVGFDSARVSVLGVVSHVGEDFDIPSQNEINDFNTAGRFTLTYSASMSGFVPGTEEVNPDEEASETDEAEESLLIGKKVATITCMAKAEGTANFSFVSGTYIKKGVFPPEEVTGTLTGTNVGIAVPIYVITASATPQEGGSISDAGEKEYELGDEPIYTVSVNPDYIIGSFSVSGDAEAELDENSQYAFSALDGDASISVTFKRQYKITAAASPEVGGSISDPGEMIYDQGATPTYAVTVNDGYIVDTFSVSSDPEAALNENSEYVFPALDQDASITVSFKPRHKVSAFAVPEGGGAISDAGEMWYPEGSEPTYTVTPAEGYMVDTFTVSTDSDAALNENREYTLAPITQDTVIIASFKTQHKITASADPEEGGSISNAGEKSYMSGTTPTYVVTVSEGYAVDGFTVSSDPDAILDQNNTYTFAPLSGDAGISVSFRRLRHTINAFVKLEDGGSVSPSGDVLVEEGGNQTFEVTVNEGWVIRKVVADGERVSLKDDNSYVFKDVNADHTFKVVFEEETPVEPETHTIIASATPDTGGSISPSGEVSVEDGKDQTFTVIPNSGWKIAGVRVDGEAVTLDADNAFTFKALDKDSGIAASFERESSEVKVYHSADYNRDFRISLGELLRVIQLFNEGDYSCDSSTEDGFAPGAGTHTCGSHDSDYSPQNWKIELAELLRLIQIYNSDAPYHADPSQEDGFGLSEK